MSARQKRSYSGAADPRPTRRRKYSSQNTVANYRAFRGLVPSYSGFNPRSFTQGEWKYLDTALNGTVDTTGGILLCNGLVPGSGASQRIGMKVEIKSIEVRGYMGGTPGTGVDQVLRWQLFLDRQTNGVAPAIGQQLLANNVYAPRSLIARKRFKILMDKTYNINAVGESGSFRTFKAYMKFRRPIVMEFNAGTAGTVADIVSNSLFFYVVGSVAAGATAGLTYGYVRIRYTDM